MKAHADFCIIPLGDGVSVSEYIVACQEILNQAGLNATLHAYGTGIKRILPVAREQGTATPKVGAMRRGSLFG